MNIWKRITKMSFVQLVKLSIFFVQNPRILFPTIQASKETMIICNNLFGNLHHGSNRENAFRHALWNYKISEKINKITKNDQKASKLTQKVTDLYEKVTKNDPKDQKMDFINNAIGREIFLSEKHPDEAKMIDFFKKMMENAVLLEQNEQNQDQLVYISE